VEGRAEDQEAIHGERDRACSEWSAPSCTPFSWSQIHSIALGRYWLPGHTTDRSEEMHRRTKRCRPGHSISRHDVQSHSAGDPERGHGPGLWTWLTATPSAENFGHVDRAAGGSIQNVQHSSPSWVCPKYAAYFSDKFGAPSDMDIRRRRMGMQGMLTEDDERHRVEATLRKLVTDTRHVQEIQDALRVGLSALPIWRQGSAELCLDRLMWPRRTTRLARPCT